MGIPRTELPKEAGPNLEGEERVVLLQCDDEEAAKTEAERLGKAAEHSYNHIYGELVVWEFVEVYGLLADELRHGSEVYSRLLFKTCP